jgi:hypothetical protein
MFISIGTLVQQPHESVRRTICDYLQTHLDTLHQGLPLREWIQWQSTPPQTPHAYIQRMRKPSTWGGAMELSAATKCYDCDILVVDGSKRQVAEFVWKEDCTARRRLVLEWTGWHYEPVSFRVL